jgi:sec-independent protein translocase protein TatB
MIDFSWTHIVILLGIALVVVGPKDLPKMMHTAGRWMAKARGMANEFRKSFDEMARQGELDELRAEIESLRRNNPLADIQRHFDQPLLPPETPAVAAADEAVEDAPLPGPEPREGEFQITDSMTTASEHEHVVLAPGDAYEPPAP